MDPIKNPFAPGAGAPPPELVGRDPILAQAKILFARVLQKRPEKSMLLTGLRGVGKTVLLNEIENIAKEQGYQIVSIEAHENKSLGVILAPHLRKVLFELDRLAGAMEKIKKGFAVLRSFIGSLKLKYDEVSVGLDIEPVKGTADSGDLETDLPMLFQVIGEAAEDRKKAIAIFIDEIQYFNQKELGALIMAMHKIQQKQLPVVLLGAGLPILPGLAGDSKSYAERLFNFPEIGALSQEDSNKAIQDPAKESGVAYEKPSLDEIYRLTQGYPYFIQEWGYQTWNLAPSSPITKTIVDQATSVVIPRLDQNFFRVRFDRLTPGEKDVLRAMADLGKGPYRTGDVADRMKVKVTSLGPRRATLIQKGMIFSPAHGEMAFTVPLFDEFMRRAIPNYRS
jgi:hypothetical protein